MHSSFDFNISRARVLIREKSVATILAIAAAALFMFGSQIHAVVEAQQTPAYSYNAKSNSSDFQSPSADNANSTASFLSQSSQALPYSAASESTRVPAIQTCTFSFTWTGAAHAWRGRIEVVNPANPSAQGRITDVVSLGQKADQAAAFSLQQGVLFIHHPSEREFDGYILTAAGQKGCIVRITLAADNQAPQTFDVKWEDLFYQPQRFNVSDAMATIRRTSGDYLRLNINRDNMVYSPGEIFAARLTPYNLAAEGLTTYNPATIKVRLQHTRENFVVYEKEYSWLPETGGDILLNIPLPQEEGVYDIIISASCRKAGAILPRVTDAVNKTLENAHLQSARELATRKVQLVVIDSTDAVSEQTGTMETRLTAEIDPANPKWWEPLERLYQFPLGLRGKQWDYPLGNGQSSGRKPVLGGVCVPGRETRNSSCSGN